MRSSVKSASLCLLFSLAFLTSLTAAAQKNSVSLWLTTPDRASLLARQSAPLRFSKSAPGSAVIKVNDKQKFQSIDGFGFALTGGSAQLLMRMDAPQRGGLLDELFG